MTLKTFAGLATAGLLAILVVGCGGKSAEEQFAAAQLQFNEAQHVVDSLKRKADLVELFTPVATAYEQLADDHPRSEQAEQALFRAAELRSQYLGDVQGALALYKRYAEDFPAAAKAPTALFMVGYLYNNGLLKPDSAEIAYKKFLELYPQSELATSAHYELQTIGKKPEDLIPNPVIPADTTAPPKTKAPCSALNQRMPDSDRSYLLPHVVAKLANMELRARLVVEGFIAGLHRSPYHGFSVEFAEHRPYMPGDEIRHVDWKVYARTDRYTIKQYEEETNLKSYIVLDTSRSMAYASAGSISKLDYASYLAASLAYMMVKQSDAVGLALFDETVTTFLPPRASRAYLQQIHVALQNVQATARTEAGRSMHLVAERIKRRGLVIVLSDLMDEPERILAALKHFRHNRNEVIVMHVLDPLERTFAFGDDATFRDMETDERMTTQPWHIRRAYADAMHAFTERYKRECREHHIDYVLLDTATPFDTALTGYLSKREKLL